MVEDDAHSGACEDELVAVEAKAKEEDFGLAISPHSSDVPR